MNVEAPGQGRLATTTHATKEETVAEDQHKHDVRQAAHEAGIEGASKLSTKDAEEALGKVKSGESPEEAKQESRD